MKKWGLYFIMTTLSFSQLEEGFVSIKINDKIGVSHHKVLVNGEDIYIDFGRFLYLIGMENNKKNGLKYHIDIGNFYGQEKIINFGNQEIVYKIGKKKKISGLLWQTGKFYVRQDRLKDIFSLKKINFNRDNLELKTELNFQAPYQEKIHREKVKEELLNNKKKTVEKEVTSIPKLFEPGNLRTILRYDKSLGENKRESKSVSGEYIGPLLYGTFSTYYDIYPDLEKREIKLVYEDIIKNQTLIIGDIAPILPDVMSGTVGRMKGISFIENYRNSTVRENGGVTITGYSDNGKTVELYQNGKLIAYTDVKLGRYEFKEIPITFYSDTYEIIIYNRDGTREKEKLKNFYNNEGLDKGKFGYNIYMGEDINSGYNQRIVDIKYGLTNNYTINIGMFDIQYNRQGIENKEKKRDKILNIGLNYTTSLNKNPFSYNIELFNNVETGDTDATLKLNIDRGIYNFGLDGGNYSGKTVERLNKKNELYAEITRDSLKILGFSVSPGLTYSREVFEDNSERNRLGIVLRGNFRKWIPEYRLAKEFNNDRLEQELSLRSYIFNNYYIEMSANNRKNYEENEMTYRAEVSTGAGSMNSLETKVFYENTKSRRNLFGLEFKVNYNDWFTAEANYEKYGEKSFTNVGVEIDRTISLSNVNGGPISRVENGWVNGVIFLDTDGNGEYNPEIDRPLKQAKVKHNGHSMETDSDGKYYFGNIYPQMPLWLSAIPLNPLQVSKTKRFLVRPKSASGVELNIPISTLKIVTGNILFKTPEIGRVLLSSLYIKVKDVETGEEVAVVIPENDGFFVIDNITTGKYLITIESVKGSLNKLYEKEIVIDGDKNDINLNIEIGEDYAQTEKKLIFDFIITYSN